MSYEELLRKGAEMLAKAGITENTLDAWLLMEYVFSIQKSWYYLHSRDEVSTEQERRYRQVLEERTKRIPLQHITNQAWFMGREFYVDNRVLVPRQDTEILVEEALKIVKPCNQVLDMCTGSGCILLSILLEKEDCQGMGVDLSGDALAVAMKNQEKAGVDPSRAAFRESDLFEKVPESFDVIVSNPPYIRSEEIEKLSPEVKDHDPWMALDGKEDGLWFYKKITEEATKHLRKGGWILYEIGHDQAADVSEILRRNGFTQMQVKKDYAGLDRVVLGCLER